MSIKIASWNILNDYKAQKHASQIDRLPEITEQINNHLLDVGQVILYLCEIQNIETLEKISADTGLSIVGSAEKYWRKTEIIKPITSWQYSAFLADEATAKRSNVERITLSDDQNDMMLKLDYNSKSILGFHIPSQTLLDWKIRKAHTEKIIDTQADIIMGDSNSMSFYISRKRFKKAGYIEAHETTKPPFPEPYYRGKNIPWWLPNITIDLIAHKRSLASYNASYSLSRASDHPLIWSNFELE